MHRPGLRTLALAAVVALAAGPADAGGPPPIGTTTVFAQIPAPGMPEGIAVDGSTVYVGTHTSVRGNAGGQPSKIFVLDAAGTITDDITITGQTETATHGILAMAFDAAGRLYVLDRNPARIIRIDLGTGSQQTYATFPDLPSCILEPYGDCSPVIVDQAPFPDYLAFTPDGSAYVTDLEQATIFRVPPGGGEAQIWFQDTRLQSVFGPNGIALDPSGTKLFFAMTGSLQPTSPTQGLIYTLPVTAFPTADDLGTFFTYLEPATGPDGIAFGESGNLYVALAGANQVSILRPDGTEAARFPDAVTNLMSEVPYDLPASIAFDGNGSLYLTNQSFFTATPEHWVVFKVWVNDRALPLVRPVIP